MSSAVDLCNMALSHIGMTQPIANLSTENSQEARSCRLFYATARDQVLRAFAWPEATRFASLALEEENPTEEWAYSYRLPSDCWLVRRILSGSRNDSRSSRTPYKIASDSEGKLLYTDQRDAEIEYTFKLEDPEKFSPDFVMALSFYLSFLIAPGLTAGDPFGLGTRAWQSYQMSIARAEGNAANEEQRDMEPDSEFIRARD